MDLHTDRGCPQTQDYLSSRLCNQRKKINNVLLFTRRHWTPHCRQPGDGFACCRSSSATASQLFDFCSLESLCLLNVLLPLLISLCRNSAVMEPSDREAHWLTNQQCDWSSRDSVLCHGSCATVNFITAGQGQLLSVILGIKGTVHRWNIVAPLFNFICVVICWIRASF